MAVLALVVAALLADLLPVLVEDLLEAFFDLALEPVAVDFAAEDFVVVVLDAAAFEAALFVFSVFDAFADTFLVVVFDSVPLLVPANLAVVAVVFFAVLL